MTIRVAQSPYACPVEVETCCSTLEDAFNSADPARVDIAQRCLNSAWEILYALSGRQFGLCEFTVRPCRPDCCDGCDKSGPAWTPVNLGGSWINTRCGECRDSCSCTKVCDVRLPGPINSVTEVKLNGEVLPSSAYRVDNNDKLLALKRPMPLEGDFQVSYIVPAGSTITADIPATEVVSGDDLGGGVYAPVGTLIRLVWRGIDCVNLTYAGPGDGLLSTARPPSAENAAGVAWNWPAPGFDFVADTPVVSNVHDDGSSVVGTLISGTAVTENPNPPPLSRNLRFTDGTVMRFCPSQLEQFCWPTCQDMNLDADQDNTWEVTYMRGRPLPQAGISAIGELACELCKACIGDESCCLPKRVTSVNRQGVSFAILDPMTFINEQLTGVYLVDLWLRSVNPKGRPRRGAILSPDMPLPRRTTWQA